MRGAAHPSAGTPGNCFFTTRAWEVGPDNFYALMEVTVGHLDSHREEPVGGWEPSPEILEMAGCGEV